jgi:hypothetical protein
LRAALADAVDGLKKLMNSAQFGKAGRAAFFQNFERFQYFITGWGTRIPAQTRVVDQKPLAYSNFASSHGGRVGALWTIVVDHSSHGGTKATSGG